MTKCSLEDRGLDVGEHTHINTQFYSRHTWPDDTQLCTTVFTASPLLKHTHTHTGKKNVIHSFQASAEDYLTSQRLVLQLLPSLSHTQTGLNHQIAGRPLLPLSVSPTLIPLHSAPSGLVGWRSDAHQHNVRPTSDQFHISLRTLWKQVWTPAI